MVVRIYRPAKAATQAGQAKTQDWLVEPERVTPRVVEPLMGWVSAADTLSEMQGRLRFPTQEDAVSFAKRAGLDYVIAEPSERRITPRNYLDNFCITRPEDEERKAYLR